VLATSLLMAPILYFCFLFFPYVFLYSDAILYFSFMAHIFKNWGFQNSFVFFFCSVYFCTPMSYYTVLFFQCHICSKTERSEKQVVVELCLYSENSTWDRKHQSTLKMHWYEHMAKICRFMESKSAGNFRKYSKFICKIRNLLTHGNVNQPETSASIGMHV
jgi:hypothetical protein